MKTRQINRGFISAPKPQVRSFTLLELIVVIIIIGILATLGFSQYSLMVEGSRTAEAKVNIGLMRKLAIEYYYKNGTLTGIQNSDVGVNDTCDSSHYFRYATGPYLGSAAYFNATRCTTAGKSPYASREYTVWMPYYPDTGSSVWYCYYDAWPSESACFGMSAHP